MAIKRFYALLLMIFIILSIPQASGMQGAAAPAAPTTLPGSSAPKLGGPAVFPGDGYKYNIETDRLNDGDWVIVKRLGSERPSDFPYTYGQVTTDLEDGMGIVVEKGIWHTLKDWAKTGIYKIPAMPAAAAPTDPVSDRSAQDARDSLLSQLASPDYSEAQFNPLLSETLNNLSPDDRIRALTKQSSRHDAPLIFKAKSAAMINIMIASVRPENLPKLLKTKKSYWDRRAGNGKLLSYVVAHNPPEVAKAILQRVSTSAVSDIAKCVGTRDNHGETALHYCFNRSDGQMEAVITALLNAIPESQRAEVINIRDTREGHDGGNTALLKGFKKYLENPGNADLKGALVQLLAQPGIDINIPDNKGRVARTVGGPAGEKLFDELVNLANQVNAKKAMRKRHIVEVLEDNRKPKSVAEITAGYDTGDTKFIEYPGVVAPAPVLTPGEQEKQSEKWAQDLYDRYDTMYGPGEKAEKPDEKYLCDRIKDEEKFKLQHGWVIIKRTDYNPDDDDIEGEYTYGLAHYEKEYKEVVISVEADRELPWDKAWEDGGKVYRVPEVHEAKRTYIRVSSIQPPAAAPVLEPAPARTPVLPPIYKPGDKVDKPADRYLCNDETKYKYDDLVTVKRSDGTYTIGVVEYNHDENGDSALGIRVEKGWVAWDDWDEIYSYPGGPLARGAAGPAAPAAPRRRYIER